LSAFTNWQPFWRCHSLRISRTVTFCATRLTVPLSNESCSFRAEAAGDCMIGGMAVCADEDGMIGGVADPGNIGPAGLAGGDTG